MPSNATDTQHCCVNSRLLNFAKVAQLMGYLTLIVLSNNKLHNVHG